MFPHMLTLVFLLFILLHQSGCKDEIINNPHNNRYDDDADVAAISSDSWAATDPLERSVPVGPAAPAKRTDKQVVIFYWTWHCDQNANYPTIGNVSEILKNNPSALTTPNDPVWDRGAGSTTHFWEQPLLGYYLTTDPWVLRKHAEMLADAGIDGVFFDCTNSPWTWKSSYDALLSTWNQARLDGVNVPKIAFILPFAGDYKMLRTIYQDVYEKGRFPELWFRFKGKPLIMSKSDIIPYDQDPLNAAMRKFFTFRPGQPDYVNGPSSNQQWGWLEVMPLHQYGARSGACEQVAVGVAQNTSPARNGHCSAFNVPNSYGRSFTRGMGNLNPFPPSTYPLSNNSYLYGYNFQEQWDYGMSLNPDVIFVTGWNEYIAGKWEGESNAPWDGVPFSFVDEFDWERSRDIEPNYGWFDSDSNYVGDTYYYQLVSNVRKFKGVSQGEPVSSMKSIDIYNFLSWNGVTPNFRSYRGNVMHRNHGGHANTFYSNSSGRNDLVNAKVARDKDYIYFYIKTADKLTDPATSTRWMWLFIDADRNKETGWEGYDYLINYVKPENGKGIVSGNIKNKWQWSDAGTIDYAIENNRLAIRVSRNLLGMTSKIDFEFKWSDNMQQEGHIEDFYINGDAAPGGRFNYIYTVD